MANMCFNNIVVKGDKKAIYIFLSHIFKEKNEITYNDNSRYYLKEIPIKDLVQYSIIGLYNFDTKDILNQNIELLETKKNLFANFNKVLDNKNNDRITSECIIEPNIRISDSNDILFINFLTRWDGIEDVVNIMSKEYPELEFEYLYEESGLGVASISKYKEGECIDSINVDNIGLDRKEDPYRKMMRDYFEEFYLTCNECYSMYDEGDVFDDSFESCEECENTTFWYINNNRKITIDLDKESKDSIVL